MIQVKSRQNKLPQAVSPPPPSAPRLSTPFPVCFFVAAHHLRLACFVWTVLKNVVSVCTRFNWHIFSSDACKAASSHRDWWKAGEMWEMRFPNHLSCGKPELALLVNVQEKDISDFGLMLGHSKTFLIKNDRSRSHRKILSTRPQARSVGILAGLLDRHLHGDAKRLSPTAKVHNCKFCLMFWTTRSKKVYMFPACFFLLYNA